MNLLRYPIMGIGFLALLLALLGGLRRIGYPMSWVPVRVVFQHGGLMVSCFLGAVIALERAVAISVPGSLLVPLLTSLGTLVLLTGYPASVGIFLIALSSLGLLGLFLYIYSIQPSLHNLVLVAGGLCWLVGNLLWWYRVPVSSLVSWWLGFLVFVVAAERLELNRLVKFSIYSKAFFAAGIFLALTGMVAASLQGPGDRLIGSGFVLLAVWLVQNDMVRKMLTEPGERGFTGWCLFTGYWWLGLGGVLRVLFPHTQSGFYYDAYLHSIFVGFVFTMIFGHAFIIMPGVLDLELFFHRGFYLPLVLLEGTLALRVAGDLLFHPSLRMGGGLGNAASIVLFFMMLVETPIRSKILRN